MVQAESVVTSSALRDGVIGGVQCVCLMHGSHRQSAPPVALQRCGLRDGAAAGAPGHLLCICCRLDGLIFAHGAHVRMHCAGCRQLDANPLTLACIIVATEARNIKISTETDAAGNVMCFEPLLPCLIKPSRELLNCRQSSCGAHMKFAHVQILQRHVD